MGMFSENYSGNRCSDCTWADNMEKRLKRDAPQSYREMRMNYLIVYVLNELKDLSSEVEKRTNGYISHTANRCIEYLEKVEKYFNRPKNVYCKKHKKNNVEINNIENNKVD